MGAFAAAIGRDDDVSLVCEVKVRSPRDGDLLGDRDPGEYARKLVAAGATAVSVVTEADHFGGSLAVLEAVREAVDVPLLAKDFLGTGADIDRLADAGADAVLLIVADLEPDRLAALHDHARERGVDALVETHTGGEVATANEVGAPVVGINNRDIEALELDDGGVERTERLAPQVREGALVVSESSLSTRAEVRRAAAAGADAVLVGTAVLLAEDPGAKVGSLGP
jgi:indole-3-glycerol phosphate synthase